MKLRVVVMFLLSALAIALLGSAPAEAAEPVVTITSPANGSTGPSDISVTGTSDADPQAYRLVLVVNGEDRYGTLRADGTWEMQYQQFDDGWNTLCAQIRDLSLTITYSSYCTAYRVLPDPLQLSILSPVDGATVQPGVVIQGYVNVASTIKVYVDGSGPTVLSGVQGAFDYDGGYLADGTYTTRFDATDTYGRTASATVTFTVDGTAPAVPTVTAPSTKKVVTTKQLTVSGTADPGSQVEIRLENGELAGYVDVAADGTWSYTFTDRELGGYYTGRRSTFTFSVAAIDDVGNTSAARSYSYTLKIAP